jgi:endonuclease YncB( thermonuclease family)
MFHKQQVRLAGIADNSFDPQAASFLGNLILKKDCEFAEINGPEMGTLRVLSKPEPIDVNKALLEEGMAKWDSNTSYNKSLKKAEAIARSAKRGVWK